MLTIGNESSVLVKGFVKIRKLYSDLNKLLAILL